VEKRPRKAEPPRLENRLQCTTGKMRTQPVLKQVDDAGTGERRFDRKVGCPTYLHDELARRIDLHHLAVAFELPRRHRTASEAPAHALVAEQVAWVLGSAVTIEIGGRCDSREALDARPDRHRDHVLFQALVIADAGVTSGRKNIDKVLVRDDLKLDL